MPRPRRWTPRRRTRSTGSALHRIELAHAVENEVSCRVAVRARCAYEGTLRQAMRYPVDGRWSDEHLHARVADD